LSTVIAGASEKRLRRGEVLFHKGDPVQGFHVVIYGQIKLAIPSAQGHEKVVEIIGQRMSFGEAVMFLDRPYPVTAEALADTLLVQIERRSVLTLLERDPSFAARMLGGLSMRLHSLLADVESYSLRSSTQRVIGYLLLHCPEVDNGEAVSIDLPTSKQVIASRLNLTPETLSRIFHDLAQAGLIEVHGRSITIPETQRLREFDV
jgi:CRP-like cAMP-binding protein